jgi:hypothetical protein
MAMQSSSSRKDIVSRPNLIVPLGEIFNRVQRGTTAMKSISTSIPSSARTGIGASAHAGFRALQTGPNYSCIIRNFSLWRSTT